jgi:hypothetical protein
MQNAKYQMQTVCVCDYGVTIAAIVYLAGSQRVVFAF